jgi:hypothetical protein
MHVSHPALGFIALLTQLALAAPSTVTTYAFMKYEKHDDESFTVDDPPIPEHVHTSSPDHFEYSGSMPGFYFQGGLLGPIYQPGFTIIKSLSPDEAKRMSKYESELDSIERNKTYYLAGYEEKNFDAREWGNTMEHMGKEKDKRILVGDGTLKVWAGSTIPDHKA